MKKRWLYSDKYEIIQEILHMQPQVDKSQSRISGVQPMDIEGSDQCCFGKLLADRDCSISGSYTAC